MPESLSPAREWAATCFVTHVARAIVPYSGAEYPHEIVDPRLADVEAVARWMDYAFVLPGGFRFGLAGIVGLIPGVGDLVDALISLYIVFRAVQLGIPRVTLARMVVNVGIEAFAGAVPLLGALFDVVFKANRRNYQLLQSHLSGVRRQTSNDWWFLIITAVLVLASIAVPLFLIVQVAEHLRVK